MFEVYSEWSTETVNFDRRKDELNSYIFILFSSIQDIKLMKAMKNIYHLNSKLSTSKYKSLLK